MRREERVTVQGPVKKQQPDGLSHGGGGGATRTSALSAGVSVWDFECPAAVLGAQCMGIINEDRNRAAEDAKGYRTALYTMVPLQCTPKNQIIEGRPPR